MANSKSIVIVLADETTSISNEAWDFHLDEIDYLCEEYSGETFILKDGRLYESEV